MKLLGTILLTAMMAAAVCAQRPREVDTSPPTDASKAMPTPAPPPQTMKAKYEGGIFGHSHTMDGVLSFDDTNQRLLFSKDNKEVLFIPYKAMSAAFSDTQKRQPSAATVAQHVPYVGWPLGFVKTKVRYLTLQYNDPDSNAAGVTSFRLDNKDLVDSVVYALANKAGLVPRGNVYVRKKEDTEAKKTP
jgi:hypothetical protein